MPLDIAAGIFIAILASEVFERELSILLLGWSILCVLLPDIDILPFFWRTEYDHRSYTHYPAVYVPVAVTLFFVLEPVYVFIFILGVLAHFIHDTIGLGWGIAWAWPLSSRKSLFPERGRRKNHGWLMTWLPEEEPALARRYHNPDWVRTYYLRPNIVAYVEYGGLIIALATLFFYW